MKRWLIGSLACAALLDAQSVTLGEMEVTEAFYAHDFKLIDGAQVRNADVAAALFRAVPTISMVRRSGIANDIILRGFKKDNISVTIDGMKLYGACPNRMDPPVSHVLAENIDRITVIEGPFDVEDYGVLGGAVKVDTLRPSKQWHGSVGLGAGSFGYRKGTFSVSGGGDSLRVLVSGSIERSGQYEDGDGRDFVGQIRREIDAGKVPAKVQYQDRYKSMDAYTKKTLMAKLFWHITDNQELRLGYTANRSDDVLYPSSKMDALYDDSDLYNVEYIAKDLGRYSKELYLQIYRSEVKHPMSTTYRLMGAVNYMTHTLTTRVDGAKIKNTFEVSGHTVTAGIDHSKRNWDGNYYKNGILLPYPNHHSIRDVDTTNTAFFLKDRFVLGRLRFDMGLRYDMTDIDSGNPAQQSNSYDELNGYVTATYQMEEGWKIYGGVGKASRVPDAKELYWIGSMGNEIGTPDLQDTINYEFDLGVQKQFDNGTIKAKAFYSVLDNFIAYNANRAMTKMGKTMAYHAYENVDATVWGFEVSGTYAATESLYFDYALAYRRGEKDRPLTGQTGTNMPEIPPLKFTGAVNFDWDETLSLRAELIASDKWRDFDGENGEQPINGYGVVNLKATKRLAHSWEVTVGVDNLFDTTYAISNTYKDLILLPTVTPNDTVMLMNEPGRYVYADVRYRF